jgi:hypothetical protein
MHSHIHGMTKEPGRISIQQWRQITRESEVMPRRISNALRAAHYGRLATQIEREAAKLPAGSSRRRVQMTMAAALRRQRDSLLKRPGD